MLMLMQYKTAAILLVTGVILDWGAIWTPAQCERTAHTCDV